MQLRHGKSEEILWSQRFTGAQDQEAQIDRAIASIAGRQGLIDAHQIALDKRRMDDGYSCLLWHYNYRTSPDTALQADVVECLDNALERAPDNPLLLEARSSVDFAMGVNPDAESRAESRAYAERALAFGSSHATANVGAARIAMLDDNCDRAMFYAQHAVELNPLDPDNLALAGSFAAACGHLAQSQYYLERATALDPNGSLAQQMGIVKLALAQNDRAQALKIIRQFDSGNNQPNPVFLLARVLIYMENGRSADARNAWAQLTEAMGHPVDISLRQLVEGFVLPDQFASAIIVRMERFELAQADGRIAT